MDAAHTLLKKSALFLALALFVMVPGLTAQTPAFNSIGTVLLAGTGGGQVTVSGTLDSTAPITFTASITATTVPGNDPPNWLTLGQLGTTTPAVLSFGLGNLGATQGTYTATIKLTPTGASAVAGVVSTTFQVSFTSGTPGGGGQGGTILATPNPLNLSANSGFGTQNTISLTTTSASSISFTVSFTPTGSWLSVAQSSSFVSSGSSASLFVTASAIGLATTPAPGSITVTPSSGVATTIPVNFTVGGGGGVGGTLTFTAPTAWTYSTGGVFPSAQTLSIFNSSASTYSASITTNTGQQWLLVNGQTGVSGAFVSSGIQISPSSVLSSLGTGNYTATVIVTDSNSASGSFTVNLSVNGGTSGGLTVSPSTGFTLNSAVGGFSQQQTVTITSSLQGQLILTPVNAPWLSIQNAPGTIFANSPVNVSVLGNAASLSNSTNTGSLQVQVIGSSNLQTTVPVTLVVGTGSGGGGGGGGTVGVAPSSLSFAYQTGTPINFTSRQTIALTGPGGSSWSSSTTTSNNGTWLQLSTISSVFQGDGSSTTTVIINPSGLGVGTYTGTVSITSNGISQSTSVTLSVVASPVLIAQPGSLVFNYHTGDPAPAPVGLSFLMSDNSAVSITAATTTPWLTVSQTAGSTVLGITASPTGMATGTYTGSVTVTQSNAANSPMTVPVVLLVNGGGSGGGTSGGPLTVNPTSLTFNAALGTNPSPQVLSVTANTVTSFSVSTSVQNGGFNWLSVNSTFGATNTNLSVSVSSATLGIGVYNGTITFTANGTTQTVSVLLNVTTNGGGNSNVTVDKTSLSFTAQAASASQSQVINVSSAQGVSGVSFTVTSGVTSGSNWLSVSPTSATTPAQISVTVTPGNLAAGTYGGTVTITPSGGTAVAVQVSLTVTAPPTVTATPLSLTFTYRAGDAAPASQQLSVTGGTGLTFSAVASSTGNWLSVAPATGATPASLTVAVNPAGLNASPTPYNGTITVAGSGGAIGTTTITVSLTITAPLPTLSKLTNAGSFASASISPGEIITLFATDSQHPIGPTPAVGLALDSTGKGVATTIGGTSVLVGGFAAPMIFASATQVSAVVPYELAGFLSADVLVKFLGQTSNALHVNVASTAPGLFTLNSSGTGPGAILNGNNSLNSPTNPAAKGETVVVYLTGEGATSPQGVTGKVTTVSSTPPLTPAPLLPVSVLIGPTGAQVPANFSFAGEAPNLVSGVMQLNVQIPATAATGDQQIIVSIGGNPSQTGVTVSVR